MKLVDLVPGKEIKKQVVKEALDDMDATLPTQVERFLNKLIDQIRGYNLSKRKEQLVIAKVIHLSFIKRFCLATPSHQKRHL